MGRREIEVVDEDPGRSAATRGSSNPSPLVLSEIRNFRLLPALQYNPITREHLLVGIVGDATEEAGFDRIPSIVG
ncbi:hypothetical protein GPA22_04570 [Aromatoleum toluvorans]|uniref:Clp R domain-containing protein n=1 Tax=Aromatoleum toluvorans TaxID=92002 RepID=A0ABX1PUH1_9RHOO|nr:hypothetical protein [Aromatoleum toluvorans]NMG43003.1 hypothetical protein [Aromatoleum toluvorans]